MDKTLVPEIVYEENPDWVNLYYAAWQSAWTHIFSTRGARKLLSGAYYGYHIQLSRVFYLFQGSGHHKLNEVAASGDCDLYFAPTMADDGGDNGGNTWDKWDIRKGLEAHISAGKHEVHINFRDPKLIGCSFNYFNICRLPE